MVKSKLPSSFFNPISILGAIIAGIAWICIFFLVIMKKTLSVYNVYMDIFTYLIVPMFIVLGLVLIAAGMIITKRKRRKQGEAYKKNLFVFDLKEPKTRNTLIIFVTVTVIFFICTVVGSYEAYNYTESNEFCGKLCHKVMMPEYTAYQRSPHARVACAECHIGEGVDWFVKAKVSGIRQVFHYLASTYPRPIETPLTNLRPAKETCEKCHWPQKFYTHKLVQNKYFLRDSANTEFDIALNMKIGPSHRSMGTTQGIHWHINQDVEIRYKANEKRDTMFWVDYVNTKTGVETIFEDPETKKSPAELALIPTRTMDCMDCHNRPSHEYRSPSYYLNDLFASGKISTSIPYLKKVGMLALKKSYSTTDSTTTQIRFKIDSLYKNKYTDVYKQFKKQIDSATTVIIAECLQNNYPEMKIDFKKYPRHIGHFESEGCFRCHDDQHKSTQGKAISKDCYTCHSILSQGKKGEITNCDVNSTLKFVHPSEDDDWKEGYCSECH